MLQMHNEAMKVLPDAKMLIGGQWVGGSGNRTMEHINPTTGQPLRPFARAEKEDVDAAVKAARRVARLAAHAERPKRRIMLSIAQALRAHGDEIATIAALETGSPRGPAGNIGYASRMADWFEYYAGWTDKLNGEVVDTYPQRGLNYIRYSPLGVIAALVTYNGPMINSSMKVAPAIAAGNVVIIRPPEMGPFGVLRMAKIMEEAGLPPGVVSVLTGGPEVADALARHPGVDKISLTGGLVVARKVMQAASEHLKPVVMELGGKSANIVFDDADLETPGFLQTTASLLCSTGQGCLLGSRLLVQDGIYDRVIEKLTAISKTPVMGDPLDPKTTMGPVISQSAVDRILGYVDDAAKKATQKVLFGGERAGGDFKDGFFLKPALLVDVNNKSRIAQEEVLGPVLAVIRFNTEEEAIALANDTTYGLHAYLHTRDISRGHRVADELEAGGVSINSFPPMVAAMPFGGYKQSGFGREGRAGLEEFVHHKNIFVPY